MLRGLFIRALCWCLRRFIPKHRAYNYEAQLAVGILYRLKMYFAVSLIRQRLKQMRKPNPKRSGKIKRLKNRGKDRRASK